MPGGFRREDGGQRRRLPLRARRGDIVRLRIVGIMAASKGAVRGSVLLAANYLCRSGLEQILQYTALRKIRMRMRRSRVLSKVRLLYPNYALP